MTVNCKITNVDLRSVAMGTQPVRCAAPCKRETVLQVNRSELALAPPAAGVRAWSRCLCRAGGPHGRTRTRTRSRTPSRSWRGGRGPGGAARGPGGTAPGPGAALGPAPRETTGRRSSDAGWCWGTPSCHVITRSPYLMTCRSRHNIFEKIQQ